MVYRHLLAVGVCILWMAATAEPVSGGVEPFTTELVAVDLSRPLYVTHAPGDFDRVFIVEQGGQILILTGGSVLGTPFLDISDRVRRAEEEQGLLGLAFHPDFENNQYFYVNYTRQPDGWTVVSRFEVPAGTPNEADAAAEVEVLSFSQPEGNHNGGWISFGPDGMLYIATGDGGGFSGDSGEGHTADTGNAQDLTNNLLGKILRIDVDSGSPYAIPPDNPFVGETGDDEIWAFGLRNPWRNAFDSKTGDLYIADVGQEEWEEIDFQAASSSGGENYGWRCMEGDHCFNSPSGDECTCDAANLSDPIYEYAHGGSPFACSITGGEVYRGCAISGLSGTYFFADWCSNQIWSFRYTNGGVRELTDRTEQLDPEGGLAITAISSFGTDARGEIYICDLAGRVHKIVPEGEIPTSEEVDSTCDDGEDNDCDGLADCADPDCAGDVACQPIVPAVSECGAMAIALFMLAAGIALIKQLRSGRVHESGHHG